MSRRLSLLIENQFPSIIREEESNLIAFLRAYYEYMEQEGQPLHRGYNHLTNQDIDQAAAEYLDFIRREIIPHIPEETLGDPVLFAKKAVEFYRSRGSEASYRLLFRLLFGQEIEFYYPSDDILRVSDGRWVEERSIRVISDDDVTALDGAIVQGTISGATARVERIVRSQESGIFIFELFLSNITGEFSSNEQIAANGITAEILNNVGPIANITVTEGGAFHQPGDIVSLLSISGSGGTARVTATDDQSAVEFVLVDGGSGYTVNSIATVIGGDGTGADFRVTSIANTEIISLNNDLILPMVNVSVNQQPNFAAGGANTATLNPAMASANVNTIINDAFTSTSTEVGEIATIETTNFGFGYNPSLPLASVEFVPVSVLQLADGDGGFKGQNAVIVANNAPGSITELDIVEQSTGYNVIDTVTINNTTRAGTQSAAGLVDVIGIITFPGRYIDTKGWLSWNNRLQDNFYYQAFSYDIISQRNLGEYTEIVGNLLHPAGTQKFGTRQIADVVVATANTVSFEIGIEP